MKDLQKIKDYLNIKKDYYEEQEINFKKLKEKHLDEKKNYSAIDIDISNYQFCKQLIVDILKHIGEVEKGDLNDWRMDTKSIYWI